MDRADTRWAVPGDLNAFFGLITDNMTQLVLCTLFLTGFGFPYDIVLTRMLPGTALGVLIGDLAYTWMAARLPARRGGRLLALGPCDGYKSPSGGREDRPGLRGGGLGPGVPGPGRRDAEA